MNYWQQRNIDTQKKISKKNIKDIEKQLSKYYRTAFNQISKDMESVYDKYLVAISEGRDPSPATLYSMDKFWQMQSQLKKEAQKLGDKEIALLSKEFEKEWINVYESISLPSGATFNTISTSGARVMINDVWLADGKTFSDRVWKNVNHLVETLNDNMINCVVTGKKTTQLRDLLMHRFKVSRSQANALVRTELAHIETEAAKQRYEDYGLSQYEFLADTDERTCKHHSASCASLDGKRFYFSEMQAGVNAVPMHPN